MLHELPGMSPQVPPYIWANGLDFRGAPFFGASPARSVRQRRGPACQREPVQTPTLIRVASGARGLLSGGPIGLRPDWTIWCPEFSAERLPVLREQARVRRP